jgi:hypothetical protein
MLDKSPLVASDNTSDACPEVDVVFVVGADEADEETVERGEGGSAIDIEDEGIGLSGRSEEDWLCWGCGRRELINSTVLT